MRQCGDLWPACLPWLVQGLLCSTRWVELVLPSVPCNTWEMQSGFAGPGCCMSQVLHWGCWAKAAPPAQQALDEQCFSCGLCWCCMMPGQQVGLLPSSVLCGFWEMYSSPTGFGWVELCLPGRQMGRAASTQDPPQCQQRLELVLGSSYRGQGLL